MLDDALLSKYMDSFFGYGNIKARLWFVGMEEGGGKSIEEVRSRLEAWARRGSPLVDDVAEFHRAIGQHRWFEPGAPTQSTWRQLIRATLLSKGLTASLEAIRTYQVHDFARLNGEVASLELLPLPSTSTRDEEWQYAAWSALPMLASRDRYSQHFIPRRIDSLRKLIAQGRPRAVVFYGATYLRHWEAIVGTNFGPGDFPRDVSVRGTDFFLVPHPAAGPSRGNSKPPQKSFEEVGTTLHALFSKEEGSS